MSGERSSYGGRVRGMRSTGLRLPGFGSISEELAADGFHLPGVPAWLLNGYAGMPWRWRSGVYCERVETRPSPTTVPVPTTQANSTCAGICLSARADSERRRTGLVSDCKKSIWLARTVCHVAQPEPALGAHT